MAKWHIYEYSLLGFNRTFISQLCTFQSSMNISIHFFRAETRQRVLQACFEEVNWNVHQMLEQSAGY